MTVARAMDFSNWAVFLFVFGWCMWAIFSYTQEGLGDRLTGSQGQIVQMQIEALQVELEILQEGR